MEKMLLQIQAVLAALSAIAPFAPAAQRPTIARALESVAAALRLGELAATAAENLAGKLAALRLETAGLADIGEAELEAAYDRVEEASAAFRAAYTQAEAR